MCQDDLGFGVDEIAFPPFEVVNCDGNTKLYAYVGICHVCVAKNNEHDAQESEDDSFFNPRSSRRNTLHRQRN